ncbi:SDR family NAD(P)-dependent oxidoreductase [Breoghania sp. L-A4]|uniref:SDR family NAD(P)-dependent oxidoreductase n=1 Tax=Breoghania sp. L-A4 TaxID=2304600 RepID=UPI000E35EEE0|nr:SDR family NAD(P)-dependent oxidoreductase [Breoghania sp. L-A4]AXS41505.1 SDR family NAD(P)-dependent oxidoreductase [Breoghania sp. L-A4]
MTHPRPPWKTVWITGASSGIGLELARLLDSRVDHVAASARSQDKLDALAAQAATVHSYPLDVTDATAVSACVAEIEERGDIDLAVLNAGAWALMSVDEFDLAAIRTGVEVNVMGVMNALDVLLPRMLSRGRGHIAIVASVAGYRGLPRSLAYGPTKAALINLAETLKTELAPRGITVSVVNPGFVDTPMTRDNPFPMPGLMSAKDAAERMLAGLERGSFEIAFPRGFAAQMKLLRLLPDALYFWLIRTFVLKS